MIIKMKHDFKDQRRKYKGYEKEFNRAMVSTLNKTITQARTFSNKDIRSSYALKSGDINKGLSIHRANARDMRSYIFTNNRGAKQLGFAPSGYKGSSAKFKARKMKRKGVKVTIKKGSPKFFKYGFIAVMPNKHIGVFERDINKDKRIMKSGRYHGLKRRPIKELKGPSIGYLFGGSSVMRSVRRFVDVKIHQIFEHELKFRMGKIK